jgi:hypothetical protein
MDPGPGEPVAGPWRVLAPEACVTEVLATVAGQRAGGPAAAGERAGRLVVAVDGRSGAGKSTFARRLRACWAGCAVVGADEVAWNAPMFGWASLAAEGVLAPFRQGDVVRYRPPAWDVHGRPGHIDVPGEASVLVFEGVGASQRALADLIDIAVWVQSDVATAERLGIARDLASGVNGDLAASVAFWHAWMADENPFLARDRPWERADLIVAGVGVADVDADVLVADTWSVTR